MRGLQRNADGLPVSVDYGVVFYPGNLISMNECKFSGGVGDVASMAATLLCSHYKRNTAIQ